MKKGITEKELTGILTAFINQPKSLGISPEQAEKLKEDLLAVATGHLGDELVCRAITAHRQAQVPVRRIVDWQIFGHSG